MFAPGDKLGSYRIVEPIGEGGMGVVYRAEHQRIGRQVALKVLKSELAKRRDAAHRFLVEARAVNDIGHPNIIDVVDFVEEVDADPPLIYMVMELLRGQDLATYIAANGPMEPAETVAIAGQIADALAAVHQRKMLHRDLKAGNIFLVAGGEGHPLKVKVLDFGAAKVLGGERQLDITDPGTALGTPQYMAPEQVMDRPLDGRTDIYALGVVLYKMLTGEVPFADCSFGKLMIHLVKSRPPPLAEMRKQGSPIPPALTAVVMCCLEKRPEDRFQTMQSLSEALRRSLREDHSLAAFEIDEDATNVMPLSELQPSRRRGLLVGAAVVIVAVVAFAVALLWPSEPPPSSGAKSAAVSEPAAPRDASESAGSAAPAPQISVKPTPPSPKARTRRRSKRGPSRRKAISRARRRKKDKRPSNLTIVDPFSK